MGKKTQTITKGCYMTVPDECQSTFSMFVEACQSLEVNDVNSLALLIFPTKAVDTAMDIGND